jgi:murein DD-endopeptidase MepM/ murein hydrolase activator NlpD
MKIILITKNHKKPINIGGKFLLLIAIAFLAICTYGGHKFVTSPNGMKFLGLASFEILEATHDELLSSEDYRNNLNAYIKQIGELNIRIEDLDKQTERIQDVMKRQIVGKHKVPKLKEDKLEEGKGGPVINDELSQKDIGLAVAKLKNKVEAREALSNKMEAMMLKQSVLKNTLPSLYPVDIPYRSSSFGWRQDPFLGVRAFHKGLDFSAATGEPIKATASGIVTEAGFERDYGKYIKISHGDGLETRYAHASKLLVSKGDVVRREQIIALVGNTGRSTGPHLHYEIRLNGRALDPKQYLKK